jgi:hypothetical protein
MSNKLKLVPPTTFSVNDLLSMVDSLSKVPPPEESYICLCSKRFMMAMQPDLWWKIKDIRKRVKNTRFRLTWGKIRKCPDPLVGTVLD